MKKTEGETLATASSLASVLAATRGLRVAARQLAAGVLPGAHGSRRVGSSREFSQARPYQPGDDPRHIDWRLFARSDRYYLRESEVETAVPVRVVLDATASMRHADAGGSSAGTRRFDLARVLAAALATLAQASGDPVGLLAVTDGRIVSTGQPGAAGGEPLERFLRTLATLEPAGRWPADGGRALGAAVGPRGRAGRGLVVVLTDGHEQANEIRAALTPLRAAGHEVLFLQLFGRDEVEFPFQGTVRFEDWETGAAMETDAGAARAAYLAGQERERAGWRRWAEAGGGHRSAYAAFRTDEPADRALRAYLRWRQQPSAGR